VTRQCACGQKIILELRPDADRRGADDAITKAGNDEGAKKRRKKGGGYDATAGNRARSL
jgi:hypothetical protein